jgi:hypothetical protein
MTTEKTEQKSLAEMFRNKANYCNSNAYHAADKGCDETAKDEYIREDIWRQAQLLATLEEKHDTVEPRPEPDNGGLFVMHPETWQNIMTCPKVPYDVHNINHEDRPPIIGAGYIFFGIPVRLDTSVNIGKVLVYTKDEVKRLAELVKNGTEFTTEALLSEMGL